MVFARMMTKNLLTLIIPEKKNAKIETFRKDVRL